MAFLLGAFVGLWSPRPRTLCGGLNPCQRLSRPHYVQGVSEPNAAMRKAWDGPDGDIWAASADQYEIRGAGHRRLLLQAAAIAPGERVLDLGAGTAAGTRGAAGWPRPAVSCASTCPRQ